MHIPGAAAQTQLCLSQTHELPHTPRDPLLVCNVKTAQTEHPSSESPRSQKIQDPILLGCQHDTIVENSILE